LTTPTTDYGGALDELRFSVDHDVMTDAIRKADVSDISIDAKPGPFAFNPQSTAVIVVDMQHDFASPAGMFGQAGLPLAGIGAVVAPTRRVLAAARAAAFPVVYLAMQFDEDLVNLGPAKSVSRTRHLSWGVGETIAAPDGTEGRVLVRDTWNTRIIEELAPQPGDVVVPKHRYSGFFETELHDVLRARGVESLIFTGCTTSVCVESTLRDAYYRDYGCVLLRDCCAEVVGSGEARTNHDATLTVIEGNFGWTAESAEFVTAIASL
jgi:ureidoacrylate peracid hydrolase